MPGEGGPRDKDQKTENELITDQEEEETEEEVDHSEVGMSIKKEELELILNEQKVRETNEAERETLRVTSGMIQTCDGSAHEDTRRWLDDVEMSNATVGTHNVVRVARRTVSGSLRKEVEKIVAAHAVTPSTGGDKDPNLCPWKTLKEEVEKAFLPADEEGHMKGKLEHVKQGEKEDIQMFNRRFRNMVDIGYPVEQGKERSGETEATLVRLYGRAIYSDSHARKLSAKEPPAKTLKDAMQFVTKQTGKADKYEFLGRTGKSEVNAVFDESPPAETDTVGSLKKEISRLANIIADKKGQARREREAYVLEATQEKNQAEKFSKRKGGKSKKDAGDGKEKMNAKGSTGKNKQKSRRKPKYDENGRPRCFNCDKYGHMARECRAPKVQKEQSVNYAAGIEWS